MNAEGKVEAKQARHVHDYYSRTSVVHGHFHTFTGTTSTEALAANNHVHNFANETRTAQNHTHLITGVSGPEAPTLMGHVHLVRGTTTPNDNHSHTFEIYTGYNRAPRNVKPRGWPATALKKQAADATAEGIEDAEDIEDVEDAKDEEGKTGEGDDPDLEQ